MATKYQRRKRAHDEALTSAVLHFLNTTTAQKVAMDEILAEALAIDPKSDLGQAVALRTMVGAIATDAGWRRRRDGPPTRTRWYVRPGQSVLDLVAQHLQRKQGQQLAADHPEMANVFHPENQRCAEKGGTYKPLIASSNPDASQPSPTF